MHVELATIVSVGQRALALALLGSVLPATLACVRRRRGAHAGGRWPRASKLLVTRRSRAFGARPPPHTQTRHATHTLSQTRRTHSNASALDSQVRARAARVGLAVRRRVRRRREPRSDEVSDRPVFLLRSLIELSRERATEAGRAARTPRMCACRLLARDERGVNAAATAVTASRLRSPAIALSVFHARGALNRPIGQLLLAAATLNELIGVTLLAAVDALVERSPWHTGTSHVTSHRIVSPARPHRARRRLR